jgi:cytochrome c-type biogenesis protein CcmH/NrfF
MNPNNPPMDSGTNVLIWGIMFGLLVVAALVLAFLNRRQS